MKRLIVAFLVFFAFATTPAVAQSKFSVNSTGDAGDFSTRNGICETAPGNGVCTLRAAIMESNANAGAESIGFKIPTTDPNYNPQTGAYVIPLPAALPGINDSVQITGPGPERLIIARGPQPNTDVT